MPRMPTPTLAAWLALALTLSVAAAQGASVTTMSYEGFAREYYLHVPDGLAGDAPLVLVLHGRGGTGPGMAALTGFDEVADSNGFIVAYPSGLSQQWNYVEGIEGYNLNVSDLGFLTALVGEIAATHSVDLKRVYVAGFSNGGFMAQRMACAATGVFAAYASVGAAGFGGQPRICESPSPASLLFIHGTHDSIVPFQGLVQQSPMGPITVLASVEQTMAFWSDKLSCGTAIDSVALPRGGGSPETQVSLLRYKNCPMGSDLVLAVVLGGGHNWPGRADLLPTDIAGNVNLDLDASEFIWQFFERHALP